MQKRLAARQVEDADLSLGLDEPVQDLTKLVPRQFRAATGVYDADRAGQVAALGNFDDRHAEVLLVPVAKPASLRTHRLGIALKRIRLPCRFYVSLIQQVLLHVRIDEGP